MAVDSVFSSNAGVISSAASNFINQTTTSSASTSSALAEATETPDVTAKEAAKGDAVAKRLLAKEQAAKQLEDPAPAQEPGKGTVVDQKA